MASRWRYPDEDVNIMNDGNIGDQMYGWARDLFPICRSITGDGVRQTLSYLQKLLPGLEIHEVLSGTKVLDWVVPDEWNVRDAFIADDSGARIVDFRENNLHLVGYSEPISTEMSLEQLQPHLHSLPTMPEAIPYVTSYYEKRWGFCVSQRVRDSLRPGKYRVVIDSTLAPGFLSYGEIILPGDDQREVLLSTYICHPSMANNELSGPVVTAALVQWLQSLERKYTYRVVFVPETIGSVTYLSKHLDEMKNKTIAGYVITCIGDDLAYSFLESRAGNTLADLVTKHIIKHHYPDCVIYSFLERGSDERQYCSPGVDLPVVSLMRTKYREFPEYHTSLDNLRLVTPAGLEGSFALHKDCIDLLERNRVYKIRCLGEPQLGRRGLFPTIATKGSYGQVTDMMNFIAYADGTNDLADISNIIRVPVRSLYPIIE